MEKEIKVNTYPKKESEISLSEASLTYVQRCDENSDNFQELKMSIQDNGGGNYLVLETERWAIDSIDDLINLLNDFRERIPFDKK